MKTAFDKIKVMIHFNGLFITLSSFWNNVSFSQTIIIYMSLEFAGKMRKQQVVFGPQETFIDMVYEVLGIMSRIIA